MDRWQGAVWGVALMVSVVMFGLGILVGITIAKRNCVEPPKMYRQSTNDSRSYKL